MTKLDVAATDFEALPARSAFAERYRKGKPQVVWTRLVADLETPVSAALKLSDGQPMSCLLESVEGGAVRTFTTPFPGPAALYVRRVDGAGSTSQR